MTTTQKTKYRRKLSAIERYNVVINEATVPYNVEAVIEGEGALDQEKWQQAVNQAAQANPGIRATLKGFLGFTKWVDSGINPVVKTIEAPEWDAHSEKGYEPLKAHFAALGNEPLADVVLVPGSPARILFRALHGLCDARGLVHFIQDTLRAMRGEPLVGSSSPITDYDVRVMHKDKVKVVRQPPIECLPTMPVKPPFPSELNYTWRRIRIEKKLPNMLPKLAIFLAKQARLHGEGEVAFTVPVDFRTLRVDVASTANLTGYLKISVKPEDTARDVMRRINQEVRDYGDCFNPPVVHIVPWFSMKFMKKQLLKDVEDILYTKHKGLPTGGIVSLGHFKREEWSCPGFQCESIIGIPGSVGKLNVLIHNYNDNTQIIFSCPEAFNREGQLDKMISDFRAEFDTTEKTDPSSKNDAVANEKIAEPA